MAKQGAMVIHVDTGLAPPHKAMLLVHRTESQFHASGFEELHENYDLIFLQSKDHTGNHIEVFPYKDYKFNIENMTAAEIEIWIEQQVQIN